MNRSLERRTTPLEWLSQDEDDLGHLKSLPTEELKQQLRECFGISVRSICRAAKLIRILEQDRGEDLSEFKTDWMHALRLVGHGQAVPELVFRFHGRKTLLKRLMSLPIPDQKRLAEGELVRMVVFDPATGQPTHKMEDPLRMVPAQAAQVFGDNHIRDEQEQLTYLYAQETKKRLSLPSQSGPFKIDYEARRVRDGNKDYSYDEMKKPLQLIDLYWRRRKPS